MKPFTHRVIRVQGSDADLVAALDEAASESWELVQVVSTGGTPTTNPAAEGSWLAVLRKVGN
jgi:hypothetical protein